MRNFISSICLFLLLAASSPAQLSTFQRELDFQSLASLYAKRYGPANWKIQALNVNVFDLRPWMERVRAARTDIEYYEVAAQYVASFQDGHSSYRVPSTFAADSGLWLDIYDGKVLLEQWNPLTYPRADFDWQVGYELISLDSKPTAELLDEFVKYRGFGNPRAARRLAADLIAFRPQSVYPRAVETPDTSTAVFATPDGERKTYTIKWTKTGRPISTVGPVPSPFFEAGTGPRASAADYLLKPLNDLHNWSVPEIEVALGRRTIPAAAEPSEESHDVPLERSWVLGYGVRNPYYALPSNFQLRLGRLTSDVFYSGTYLFEGKRIGYLRIPNFAPTSSPLALSQFSAEIAFFKANTDGLVVDVSRNTGGGCIGLDYARRLLPERFTFFGEQLRPTQSLLNSYASSLQIAQLLNAEPWVIAWYQMLVEQLETALRANRAMTGSWPACTPFESPSFPAPQDFYEPLRDPAGNLVAYDKAIVFLADEFSVSFGDIFPAVMQDNRRGPIVGMRTGGLGGSISGFLAGFYSEATATNTNSLVVRRDNVVTPEFPTAPYIENIGVRPDRELDYMTRDNLIQRGAPFVDAFSRILLEEIAKRP